MITKEMRKDEALVYFEKEFMVPEVQKVKEIFNELRDTKIVNITFDISKVKYIDSSAIGMLVTILKYSKKNNGNFKLYLPTEEVKRILKLVNLYSFFEITDSL